MKKSIILLCAFFATLHVYAQDVPAILFFQNDSIIQSFLRSEVDSLGYSYVDINGETQNEVATQLVYLKDTIIQIPLAEIDSVVYTPPSYSYYVITRSPENIGHFKATLCGTFGGKIAPDAIISDTGFFISFHNEKGDVELLKVCTGQSVIGDFEKEIDFKKPEYGCRKIYYYKAYAVVNHIMYIGAERTIFLNDIYLSPYGEDVQKEPTEDPVCSATIYGELFLGNEKEIKEAGFPMGFFVSMKDNNPTEESDDVIRIEGSFNDNNLIEGKMDGLEPGTKYYYSPFIETCKMEIGGTGSFITPPQIIVTTGDFETKATTAKFSLTIDVKMYERQLEVFPVGIQIIGSRYSSDDEEYEQFDYWHYTTPHQDFSGTIYNLIPNARYSYRAYADINGKKFYGEWAEFVTKDLEVKTYDAITLTSTMADVSGELMEVEAMKIGEYYGFYYDTQPNVGINSMKLEWKFSNLDISPKFSETLIDLNPDITYYYRAFVTYKGKIYFGEIKIIGDIVVNTYDATDITTNSAHITGEVMNKNINFEGEKFGFYYDTQASLDTNSPYSYGIFTSSSNGSFYMNMSKLTPETTYYYRAFVTYKGKTCFGEVKHFTTKKEEIIVNTYDASDVTSNSAHITGEVMNKDVNFEGEKFGFYYDTQASLDTNSPYSYGTFTSSSSGSFYMNMSKLTPETTYYYRAFVTYKGKTYLGEVKHFTTKKRINDVVPEDILEKVEPYMPIYDGDNPPSVEGTYLMSPMTLFYDSNPQSIYKPGDVFNDQYLSFYDQDMMNGTINYYGFNVNKFGDISRDESGQGAFISGMGDRFSIFFNTEGDNYADDGIAHFKTALIISGTKTAAGIQDVYYAFVMIDKYDPNNLLVMVGDYRVFKDGNGLAEEVVGDYNIRTRALKSESSPLLPSCMDSGTGVSFQKGIPFDVWKKKWDERMKTK